MTYLKNLPSGSRMVVQQAKTAADAYSYLENMIVVPLNDTLKELAGAQMPNFYAKKIEGRSFVHTVPNISGGLLGGGYYEYPNKEVKERGRIVFAAPDNNIYMLKGGRSYLLRNVTDDGYHVDYLSVWQAKKYLYCSIGDPNLTNYTYRYQGEESLTIASISNYNATVPGTSKLEIPSHGLQTGMTIDIKDITVYNGTYTATVIDTDNVYISKSYSSNQTGTAVVHRLVLFGSTALEANRILTGMENRMVAVNTSADSGTAQYSNLDVGAIFDNYIVGTGETSAGQLAGGSVSITAAAFYSGITFLFERSNIWAHRIGEPITLLESAWDSVNSTYYSYEVLAKDTYTLERALSVDGFGTSSVNGVLVARGEMYYVDESNGVYSYYAYGNQYSATGKRGKELSSPIRETITKYDLSSVALGYSPKDDLLLVACSFEAGGINDTVFVYSFQTESWSKISNIYVDKFIWNDLESQMYILSSNTASVIKMFDGTHFDEYENPIGVVARSRYFDGGRRSQLKEYMESSIIMGIVDGVEEAEFSLLINSESESQAEISIPLNDIDKNNSLSVLINGTFGEDVPGEGFGRTQEQNTYIQYYNYSVIDDHRRCAIEIREKSGSMFAIYNPEMVQEVMDQTSDDFL